MTRYKALKPIVLMAGLIILPEKIRNIFKHQLEKSGSADKIKAPITIKKGVEFEYEGEIKKTLRSSLEEISLPENYSEKPRETKEQGFNPKLKLNITTQKKEYGHVSR